MANLIITIIAIALVAVAALMGAYYGGTAFNQGQTKAKASSILNQGAQIQAAVQMYVIDNLNTSGDISNLTSGNYLAQIPALDGESWAVAINADGTATATLTAANNLTLTTGAGSICGELLDNAGNGWGCTTTSATYTF